MGGPPLQRWGATNGLPIRVPTAKAMGHPTPQLMADGALECVQKPSLGAAPGWQAGSPVPVPAKRPPAKGAKPLPHQAV